jgi:hypothetical protein
LITDASNFAVGHGGGRLSMTLVWMNQAVPVRPLSVTFWLAHLTLDGKKKMARSWSLFKKGGTEIGMDGLQDEKAVKLSSVVAGGL